ncbi:D-alanine--D-alanine ligase family protein [Mycetocola zhadangensis]|uniref:D-alanine--D-alanine ligase n=1 Tax=Mycetocola zhadangensis TaxID=1164595 RepID=A0A3L7J0R8_9MICO|nr:D-alanine--D-alanine ligase [Mycetocola zhadangensis]RLQ84063.1 D-alanine--D-alanine ligase [Mycetocola zhadangensis]GGE96479.1 D-alanine--D-alanine ligase [Mycetocola zhadangensis]
MTDFKKLDIVVLSGGISHERDVSLRSGRRVAEELQAAGHTVTMRDPDAQLLPTLTEKAPDVIWPALHGASGEDGALQALLRARGIRYVGSHSDGAGLAWFKPTAKALVSRAGIATPEWLALPNGTFRELGANGVLDEVVHGIGAAAVVKPAQGGSAQGVTIVTDVADLPRAMVDAYTYSDVALIEKKIEGTELAITVMDSGHGPVALPAVEIEPLSGVYSFEARYNAGETTFYAPARVSEEIAERAGATAVEVHKLLGLRHLSRIDLIVDQDGVVWFLEANMLPGLTETSLVPQAIQAAGLTLASAYSALALAAASE